MSSLNLTNIVERAKLIHSDAPEGTALAERVRAEIRSKGTLNTSRFIVQIGTPRLFSQAGKDVSSIMLMCTNRGSGAALPGIQLNTSSIRRYGTGLEERKPISSVVIDQQFMFISDRSALIRDFFYMWMNSIITSNKFSASDTSISDGISQYRYPGSVTYKKDYAVDIDIFIYDDIGKNIYSVKLYNAYPTALGDVNLGWANSNELMQIPVTFTFTHWSASVIKDESEALVNDIMKTSLLQTLQKIGSAALLLSTLKKPTNIQDILSVVNNAKTVIDGFNFKFGG